MSIMTLDETLTLLFEGSHTVDVRADGTLMGEARLPPGLSVSVIGVVDHMPLGVEGALTLAHRVLAVVRANERQPIIVLIDSDSQRMSRRDELLGLNEYLAHLAKAIWLADRRGHPTLAVLYGGGAAGALIATALATRALIAFPTANPAVMDLPSISRITKLPLELLQQISGSTPVFAPGLENMRRMGAVTEVWDVGSGLARHLGQLLRRIGELPEDDRDQAGEARGGRTKAAWIAAEIMRQARRHD
jgi:malonate decarboxylase gamma subunit